MNDGSFGRKLIYLFKTPPLLVYYWQLEETVVEV